ncbi:response regulator [Inquilinus sp. KBS0705]|nr:response regulator [Inquilinus sp. KBS0705]
MKKRILVIEDDLDILEIVKLILSKENFDVVGIAGTNDIYEEVNLHAPDVILTDFFMPGFLPGGQICVLIKQAKHLAHLPVVLMSAYSKVAVGVCNFPYDAYLKKPFDIKHFIKVIKSVVE